MWVTCLLPPLRSGPPEDRALLFAFDSPAPVPSLAQRMYPEPVDGWMGGWVALEGVSLTHLTFFTFLSKKNKMAPCSPYCKDQGCVSWGPPPRVLASVWSFEAQSACPASMSPLPVWPRHLASSAPGSSVPRCCPQAPPVDLGPELAGCPAQHTP